MKRIICLCLLCIALLTSCAAEVNPLTKAQSTPVPGLPIPNSAASIPVATNDQMNIELFFRYQQTGLLACETRTIAVPKDESAELAVIRQLLAGPQASHEDLVRLFPHNTSVIEVFAADDTLMVTLSEGLLNDGLPANWAEDPVWIKEAPLRRQLTIQSLVATLTENFPYPYVQIFLAHEQTSNVSTRLDNAYFLDGRTGPSQRLMRDESCLMTMQNTALHLLEAWYQRDYERLYQFTAISQSNDHRPFYQEFASELDSCMSLSAYRASAGHSPAGSDSATVVLELTCMQGSHEYVFPSFPLRLVREDGIWKVPYSELKRLMLRSN
ncbi:MAG: GerMN domain-containing protein [Clostridia bacterium]|nr:GerMN domain-containing protein [Clostridia bacterium]